MATTPFGSAKAAAAMRVVVGGSYSLLPLPPSSSSSSSPRLSSFSSSRASSVWGTTSVCEERCQPFSVWRSRLSFRPAGGSRKSCSLLVLSRKRSGFAELLFQKRLEQQAMSRKGQKLKPGVVSPQLPVPSHIPRPPYVNSPKVPKFSDKPQIQNTEGITHMRASCKLAAHVRDYAGTLVKPGVTTDEIDKAVHKMIIDAGAYPSPLGYGGFPKSVCTSVNECICHGIPDSRPLQDGDIVNIDVTVYLNGYHGDTSKTFFCGSVDDEAKKLVEVTRECLEKAVAVCGPGVEYNKIGKTIQLHADKHGYGVVQRFIGHGVGKIFHSAPTIFHFRNDAPGRMQVGETFTIEPMLTQGSIDDVMWDDKWTYVTADGSLSAQFEHTLLITDSGSEILTV